LTCQICVLPSTRFDLTSLIHCSTNHLALCLAPQTTGPHPLHKMNLQSSKWRSSGTDILCGCHLPRCSYNILYFLWLYYELFIILCNKLNNCWVRLLSNYNIKYNCTIYTGLNTCLMSISRCVCYIYVCKLNQTVLAIYCFDLSNLCSTLDGIWPHTIDALLK
jgi:hypothetical protein